MTMLHHTLQQGALLRPGAVAVIVDDHPLTYKELWEWSLNATDLLQGLGTVEGDRVMTVLPSCAASIALAAACSALGATLVPVNATFAVDELLELREFCEPRLVVVDAAGPAYDALAAGGRVITRAEVEKTASGAPIGHEVPGRDEPDRAAYIFFTSGSTGTPKGIVVTHRQLLGNATSLTWAASLRGEDRGLLVLPQSHGSTALVPFAYFMVGGSVIIVDGFSPQSFGDAARRHGASHTMLVPTALRRLLDHWAAAPEQQIPRTLRVVQVGGSSASRSLLVETARTIPHAHVLHTYGQTEAVAYATGYLHPRGGSGDDDARWDSCGAPLVGRMVRVVSEDARDLPAGEVGHILIGGETSSGYWKNPEETAEVFRDGWIRTGDLGVLDVDGNLYIRGRVKEMIITGGENVFPADVEEALDGCPDIQDLVVAGTPDDDWGEVVTAFVVSDTPPEDVLITIREHCRGKIAAFRIPKRVVVVDQIPRTATGKPNRSTLSESVVKA